MSTWCLRRLSMCVGSRQPWGELQGLNGVVWTLGFGAGRGVMDLAYAVSLLGDARIVMFLGRVGCAGMLALYVRAVPVRVRYPRRLPICVGSRRRGGVNSAN